MTRKPNNKILQISSVHPSFDTRIFHKICKSLTRKGYDLDLIIQHPEDEVKEGVNIVALPIAEKKSDRLFKIVPALFTKCLSYPRGTVIHFHDPELIPLGILLKLFGYIIIYDVHEDVPRDILSKEWIPAFIRKVLSGIVSLLERLAIAVFDAVIVVTPTIHSRFESDETILVQNFPIVDESNLDNVVPAGKSHLFYLGDITIIRGIKELVQSMVLINEKHDLRLFLGGKFSPLSLKKELEKENGWEFVDFIGWVDRGDIQTYTSRSLAGILNFHPVPNHIEAQPNKLFEYMLYGLPVIASDFPLWRDIIKNSDSGLLIDPLSPKSIADAVNWLLKNPETANEMGVNGRRVVLEKYNWKTEEKKLLSLYNKLLSD